MILRIIDAGLAMKEAAFFHGTPTLCALLSVSCMSVAVGTVRVRARGREVRDILRQRVLRTDGGNADVCGFASFRESVVAGVEVLAFLVTVPLMVSRDATLARMIGTDM